jgi:hypothetical protein
MTDVTESVANVYRSLQQVFEDINKLGADFGQALREEGLDFTGPIEYSHSPNTLSLKRDHAWFFSRPEAEPPVATPELTFAACLVYFEAERGRWKVGSAGLPELWFFMGTVSPPPPGNLAGTIRTFFDKASVEDYDAKPTLGGRPAFYKYAGTRETWNVTCLGYELGEIESLAALKAKALQPLVAEATRLRIVA